MRSGGLKLTYTLGITFLTCALIVTSSSSDDLHDSPQDPKIRQVTDNHNPAAHTNLLGTTTELRFKSFIQEYEKSYSTREEYVHRLGVFAKNLIRAAEHQAMDPTAIHGVTRFSDLTEEEFEMMYMGVKGGREVLGNDHVESAAAAATVMTDVTYLPENFDWREKGAVTEVKMQVA